MEVNLSKSTTTALKEVANDEIGLVSSTKSPFLGLATIVAGSFLFSKYEEYRKDQRSSCLSLASSDTSPLMFAQSNVFPENYDVSVRAIKGSRLCMEDEYYINNGGRFVAIFDGHGGGGVSTFLRDKLYNKIAKHLNANHEVKDDRNYANSQVDTTNDQVVRSSPNYLPRYCPISAMVNSIRAAFTEAGNEVLQMDDFQYQGSTALAVWLHEDVKSCKRTLVSANLGDSRAIISRDGQAMDVTRDHKPSDEVEKKRILSMGEKIEWDDYCQVHRVRNLSLSRAIGDRFAKPAISGEVEIQLIPLSDRTSDKKGKDEFIVLASDGLWDVMTSQDCVNFIHERLNDFPKAMKRVTRLEMQRQEHARRKTMSRFVANEALKRGSGDNVCVVIVW
eukprot:CAMPEP_0198252856 /NCGR_PEP_ID=MMETSP1447-20131203/3307_1 /TAXON_ID=420782 /ORGANISM="Chaetoceros dichaeta, Strain CCMP1751" /LENGTH=390 /DNA_ID=CAMNT_0043938251 /DNA_START=394 /DNA_END=1564 /DNA_ORIENTATION=-